jgi:hypothetical protein
MMRNLLVILSFIISANTFAQVSPLNFKGTRLTTDQLGYYYEISENKINKFTESGTLDCAYSNNLLGVIANVDVSNPQKILVYFRDFTKILFLDNTLSPSSEVIDLTDLELDETLLVCRSYNDGIWYYDPVHFKLTRKNQELITTNTSGNLANLLNTKISANFLVENNNRLYLNDQNLGILVFDNYGTYLKTLPLIGLNAFQVKDKQLVYCNKNNKIETYDFFTLETMEYKPHIYSDILQVRVETDKIFIVDKNGQLFIDKIK